MAAVPTRPLARSRARDAGVTLIEVLVVMVLGGLILGTATWSFVSYQRAHEQKSTALRVTSTLRNAAERALSEGRTYCVYLNVGTKSFDTYRQDCTDATKRVTRAATDSGRVGLANVAFPAPSTSIPNQSTACPAAGACAYFYPRGNALAGTLTVTRSGSTKVFTVTVEGLTARVSQS